MTGEEMIRLVVVYETAYREFHDATDAFAAAEERERAARYAKEDAETKLDAHLQILKAEARLRVKEWDALGGAPAGTVAGRPDSNARRPARP